MKAIFYHEYGSADVLEVKDIDKPLFKDNEVLVRVHAASVNRLDWHLMRGSPHIARLQAGLRKPKDSVLGADVRGQVEAVGKHVTKFRPGDEVFGSLFGHGFGAFAEYVSVSDELLELKPANLSFDQATVVPVAALTALQGLRDHGRIEPGQKVLGRAVTQAGEPDRAAAELKRAAAAFDSFGSLRHRAEAEGELRRLGRPMRRRTRPGKADGVGLESLTERERQVARLVVDRKTNREIAEALFLSPKTVETHMRNIFRKLDVSSRVEVARVVERADRSTNERSHPPSQRRGAFA
jgi:DNA-binding CsgD family transcriptional regulator